MPERPGPWNLLDRVSDPVVADTTAVDERLQHFRSLTQAMQTEGQRLSAIASGSALTGQYADQLRTASGAVANDMNQVVSRYQAVVQAITTFQPEIDAALTASARALNDAIDASGSQSSADAMPVATPTGSTALTPQQVRANSDKTAATSSAGAALESAKTDLSNALSQLDDAGRQAAATVRGGFNDGLKDSTWDRFKYGFVKFLKIFVKVLTYIGMALSVIALVIPGLGEAIFAAGIALAAVTLVADVTLKALGSGSWADIAVAAAGLLTFGAAKVFGPTLQSALKPASSALKSSGKSAWGAVKATVGRVGSVANREPDIVDHLQLGPVPSIRWTTGGLTDDEVLREYTADGYALMNRFTRDGPLRSAEEGIGAAADIGAIERALDARPPFIGTTMRGTSLPTKTFNTFQPGKTVTSDSLWSSSTKKTVAESFSRYGGGVDAHFTIAGKTGRSISDVSFLNREKEVLFKPWTTFRVDSKTWDAGADLWRFKLTEV